MAQSATSDARARVGGPHDARGSVGAASGSPSPWPRRLLVASLIVLAPLFVFGGSVTTLGAGMAVTGWLNAEGTFMPFFPIDKWFRDLGTFVEHSHRMIGMTLGFLMIAAVVVTWRRDSRRSARGWMLAALLAICVQGVLGGLRVDHNSPELAFVHGVFSQLVIAVMAAAFVHQSPRWRAWSEAPLAAAPKVGRLARIAAFVVFVQIALGAWYRHALRTGLEGDVTLRLWIHAAGALVVLGHVLPLALRVFGLAAVTHGTPWLSLARGLLAILVLQIVLGLLAWMAADPTNVGFFQWLVATGHVLGGGLLLAWCVAVAMWAARATDGAASPAALGSNGLEGPR